MRFGVAQAILDRGFEVAFLVADIEALALEHVSKYALRLVQSIDGVGQLNLAATPWLFDELLNVVKILIQHVARINHTILGYFLVWHLHHGNR